MKKLILVLTILLISGPAFAQNHGSGSTSNLGAMQVNFDGSPVFNLYDLCVSGDMLQSMHAYSNCVGDTDSNEDCTPSIRSERLATAYEVCKPGSAVSSEGDCDTMRVPFPLVWSVPVVDPGAGVSSEGDEAIVGYTNYRIPACNK